VAAVDILFLTGVEHSLLLQRFPQFADTYTFAEEAHTFTDSARRMMLRLSLVRLRSPSLIALRDRITAAQSLEDAALIIAEHDLAGVPDEDLSQIVFALGPDVLSQVIWMLIRRAHTIEELEQVAVLSFLRHEILSSYAHV
jgi:hypothetical protein